MADVSLTALQYQVFLSYRRIRKQAAWQSKTDWPTEKPLYPKRLCAPYSESFLPPVISSCTGQKADVKFPSWGVWFWKNNLFQKSRCFQKFGKAAVSGSVQASFFLCGYHRVQDRFLHSLCRCFKCLVDFFFFYPAHASTSHVLFVSTRFAVVNPIMISPLPWPV